MHGFARGTAPQAWRRLGKRVLFAPVCMPLLVGCRTIDDDRHWGYHHDHRHHHSHRPFVHRPLTAPTFRHWHREPHSGAHRDHGARHRHDRGREHRRRGR